MECTIGITECIYTGEVNQEDAVCGEGFAIPKPYPEEQYRGTFLNGKNHGLRKSISKIYTTLFFMSGS